MVAFLKSRDSIIYIVQQLGTKASDLGCFSGSMLALICGIFFGIFMAVQLCHLDASNVLGIKGLLLLWISPPESRFISFLRWPCLAYRQVLQRWLVVVFTAFVVAWIVNPAPPRCCFTEVAYSFLA